MRCRESKASERGSAIEVGPDDSPRRVELRPKPVADRSALDQLIGGSLREPVAELMDALQVFEELRHADHGQLLDDVLEVDSNDWRFK